MQAVEIGDAVDAEQHGDWARLTLVKSYQSCPLSQGSGTVFDDNVTAVMGAAFDSVCQELHDRGQPPIVYEVIATRIIDAAKKGERDPIQLRRASLAALGLGDKDDW